jgi:general secretion pathway protein G
MKRTAQSTDNRRCARSARNAAAMTLVEVLAVIVILALLTATLAVGLGGSLGKGRRELAKTAIGTIMGKIEVYHLTHRAYPPMDVGLAAMTEPLARPTDAYFLPPDALRDPWGQAFVYVTPGPDGYPFEVLSLGSDRATSGTGDAADVSSRRLGAGAP